MYNQNEDLIQIGAYESGSNTVLDTAIALKSKIDQFLIQQNNEVFSYEDTLGLLEQLESESQ